MSETQTGHGNERQLDPEPGSSDGRFLLLPWPVCLQQVYKVVKAALKQKTPAKLPGLCLQVYHSRETLSIPKAGFLLPARIGMVAIPRECHCKAVSRTFISHFLSLLSLASDTSPGPQLPGKRPTAHRGR